MGWFKRYRHSRGFGIHSPFAFRFVTEVIEEKLPYYDYDKIKDESDRLIYRIACRFQPRTLCALGVDGYAVCMAVGHVLSVTPEDCDLLLADASADVSAIDTALRRPDVVTIIKGRGIKGRQRHIIDVMNEVGYGMSFSNERDMLIAVMSPKLPRQDFTVKF